MFRPRLLGLAIVLGLLFSATLSAATVVEQGQPRATIVVARGAVDAETEPTVQTIWTPPPRESKVAAAARDLQLYVEKISGAKLPIVGDDQAPAEGVLILVGRSALTQELDPRIPSGVTPAREEEGYVVIAEGDRVLLAGNDDGPYHGTEYAVARFLHDQGVRWYMPGEFGEVVPRKQTVTIEEGETRSTPDFKMRNWWGPQRDHTRVPEYRWKIRNGMNPVLDFITLPRDSSVHAVVPKLDPNKPEEHEELLPLLGQRPDGKPHEAMPNLSNPASAQYAAEVVKKHFREHPESDSFGIGPDDGLPRDFRPESLRLNQGFYDVGGRFGVPGEASISEEWIAWINAVAEEVAREFPNHVITTNGYANRNTPPQGVDVHPNVWVMFAAIWSDTLHAYDNPRSWQTLRQGEMIKDWAALCPNVYMYNYIYFMLASAGPVIPLARKHIHDMPLYKEWGVIGFSDEGRTLRGETGVYPTYLRARMMWDANLDHEALLDEFFRDWYGPAAEPARAFWDALEETMETTPMLGHEDRIMPYVYSPELISRLEEHLRAAEAAANDDWSRTRVRADRLIYEHLKDYLAMHEAEWEADFPRAVQHAERMLGYRQELSQMSPYFFDPDPDKGGEAAGFYYWGIVNRRDYYQQLADLTGGKTGRMVGVLPEEAKFTIDPRDDGRFFDWYATDFDDSGWDTLDTTAPFYTQGEDRPARDGKREGSELLEQPYRDSQGFPYMGAMWYRLEIDVPAAAGDEQGRKVMLYAPAVETEAWVWVNGEYVGHRPYREAYERPNQIDMDVTDALKRGERNTIAIRVHTGMNPAQQSAGLTSRLFLYSPDPAAAATAE